MIMVLMARMASRLCVHLPGFTETSLWCWCRWTAVCLSPWELKFNVLLLLFVSVEINVALLPWTRQMGPRQLCSSASRSLLTSESGNTSKHHATSHGAIQGLLTACFILSPSLPCLCLYSLSSHACTQTGASPNTNASQLQPGLLCQPKYKLRKATKKQSKTANAKLHTCQPTPWYDKTPRDAMPPHAMQHAV